MENIISEYQRWKQQGASIRTQAREAMEARFRELLTEAAEISQEYLADFGVALKLPPSITAFKFKAGARGAAKGVKSGAKKPAPVKATPPKAVPKKEVAAAPPSANVLALEKKLAAAKKKLDAAKTAGTATRNLEDRIYEIEDELRLATTAG